MNPKNTSLGPDPSHVFPFCIDNCSVFAIVIFNMFLLQMLTNAKLRMTAAISMLIVSIVLGHFLAFAGWDIKETVLSASVSSDTCVDTC